MKIMKSNSIILHLRDQSLGVTREMNLLDPSKVLGIHLVCEHFFLMNRFVFMNVRH